MAWVPFMGIFRKKGANSNEASTMSVPLHEAAVDQTSRTNQRESDIGRSSDVITTMLRDTTDGRVHIASIVTDAVGLSTDYVLSPDSASDVNRYRITAYVDRYLDPEIYELYEKEDLVADEHKRYEGFPKPPKKLEETLVVRVHARLLIYTPLRYWFSKLTLLGKLVVIAGCLYIVYFMTTFG